MEESKYKVDKIKSEAYVVNQFCFVIPVYNIEKWLPKCLESIENQTYGNYNVVLIDDGSTDSCPQICDEFVATHSNSIVVHKQNGGLVDARNCGLRVAESEYICPVDGDDWVAEDYIETLNWVVNFNEENADRDLDIIYFGHKSVGKDYVIQHQSFDTIGHFNSEEMVEILYPSSFTVTIFLSAWCSVFKKNLLQAHYCRDTEISMHEDFAFTYECLYNARNVYVLMKPLYFYNRRNERSISSVKNHSKNFLSRLKAVIYMNMHFTDAHPRIRNQLCYSFFLMAIYDFFSMNSRAEAKAFKKELTPTHLRLLDEVAVIIKWLNNYDVKAHGTIMLGTYLLKHHRFKLLYTFIKLQRDKIYKEIIY